MRWINTLLVTAMPAAVVMGGSGMAVAQIQDAPAQAGSGAVLDEIIVTARRRDERAQDVPAAITAVGAAELSRYGATTVTDIASRVPALVIGSTSGPGGANINLRGVGSAGTTPTVDQAVSLNLDGVQLSQSNAITMGIYDLNHVEVLKGPQALFFGKNSIGGIISLISADPGDSYEWRIRSGYEFEAERKQIEAMISVPVSETLGVRLVGAVADQNGFYTNSLNSVPGGQKASTNSADEQKEYFLRGTAVYSSPSGVFDAKLKMAYAKTDRANGLGSSFQLFSCPLGVPQTTFGVTGGINDCRADANVVDPTISAAAAALAPKYLRDGQPFFEQEQFLSALNIDVHLSDDLQLTSVSGIYDYQEDWSVNYSGVERQTLATAAEIHDKQFTQELRLASSFSSPFNFLVGGYYQDAKKNFNAPLILDGAAAGFNGPLLLVDDRFEQKTTAYSTFAQAIYAVSEEIELTAGGRYSHEEKRFEGVRYPSALTGFSPGPVPFRLANPKVSFNNFSPEITARYRPSSEATIYAAYREGFTSGGYNAAPGAFSSTAVNASDYKQATARGGEFGVKGTFADRQVSYDLSTYLVDYKNLQLPIFDPATISLNIRNAGSSRVKGAEFSGSYSPDEVEGLTLRTNIAFNRGRYKDYKAAACYAGQSVTQGCNGTSVPVINPATGAVVGTRFSTQDLSGGKLERSPDWSLGFGFNYDAPITKTMNLLLSGDANYTGSLISMPEHDPRSLQPDAWRFNASIGVRDRDDAWELSLIGKNLANTQRIVSAFGFPLTGGLAGQATPGLGADLAGSLSESRTVMLQFTLRNGILE